jgi:glycosyltransferase involved in cell wall biosynthesis
MLAKGQADLRAALCEAPRPMRICLVYDCLFPYTVGGAERWYRNLAQRLADEGHEVTYLTLRQWDRGEHPSLSGVEVAAVAPRMALYVSGRRRILPPLVFGLGVLGHLVRRGSRYDVVHTASFPYFSLLAAAAARRLRRFRLVVDWHELWTRDYWLEYLGAVGGRIGWAVQRRCVRRPQRAFCFSRLHERRLREEGLRGEVTLLEGQYAGTPERSSPRDSEPVVVFAGRQIPEKRVPALVRAFDRAGAEVPGLRCEIYGDGPERGEVLRLIDELGLSGQVQAPGFVPSDVVDRALAGAMCLALPSRREGYGLVVIEAAARGTPTVVVRDQDNAAVELVEDGVNGVVAASASPEELGAAIVRVHRAGAALRESTAHWFARNARRLSLDSSLDAVIGAYEEELDR